MGKIVINEGQPVGYTFNGFDETFPKELMGIVPVREYMRAIEILNSNGRRVFKSYYLYSSASLVLGIVLIFILIFVEAIRWLLFIKSLRKDLGKCCDVINETMILRKVVFKIDITSTSNGTITITYPDVQPLIPKETIQLVGGDIALLLPPVSDSRSIVNPLLYCDKNASKDANYKNLIFRYNQEEDETVGFWGFETKYNYSLYNYISPTEFKEIMDDFNNNLKCYYPINLIKFYLATMILGFVLIGILLVIPYYIWLSIERKKLLNNFKRKAKELKLKYNNLYSSRGVSFDIIHHNSLILGQHSLNICFPSDTGNAPVVARISNSDQLVLAPAIPNGVGPYFQVMNMV